MPSSTSTFRRSSSSGGSRDSAALARRVRYQAFLRRQRERQVAKKVETRKWMITAYPYVWLERIKSVRVLFSSPTPGSSPVKRGVQYVYDNVFTPTKRRIARLANRTRALPGLFHRNQPNVKSRQSYSGHTSGSHDSGIFSNSDDDGTSDVDSEGSGDTVGTPSPVRRVDHDGTAGVAESSMEDDAESEEEWLAGIEQWRQSVVVSNSVTSAEHVATEVHSAAMGTQGADAVMSEGEPSRPTSPNDDDEPDSRCDIETTADVQGGQGNDTFVRRVRRDRTRYHPYSSSAGLVRTRATRRCLILQRTNTSDRFVLRITKYELDWRFINADVARTLTFSTIPWPVFNLPVCPDDITRADVQDFIRFATSAEYDLPMFRCAVEVKKAAQYELEHRWGQQKFTEAVLARVIDEEQARMACVAVRTVQDALSHLAAFEVNEST